MTSKIRPVEQPATKPKLIEEGVNANLSLPLIGSTVPMPPVKPPKPEPEKKPR